MHPMKIIGITGGTGAGKTTALKALEKLGARTIDCDEVYHRLLSENEALRRELTERFGDILQADGTVDRKKLGAVVFDDPKALSELNQITHRYVVEEVGRLIDEAGAEGKQIAAVDAVALLESGLGGICHQVVGLIAPEELRVKRIMRREGIGEAYARLRVRAQKPDSFFREHCDAVLVNTNDDFVAFEKAATQLFQRLLCEIENGEEPK